MKNLDRIQGSLIAGAAGDALGYSIEFMPESMIFNRYGPEGIQSFDLRNGLARISDDTQMTLFTANGLLSGETGGKDRGDLTSIAEYISCAYDDWFKTQTESYSPRKNRFFAKKHASRASWLLEIPELYSDRAPGITCMSAIQSGKHGTPHNPINTSKGCGGIMRVAPIGLYFDLDETSLESVMQMGAETAALTHGHELGWLPAGLCAGIIACLASNAEISPSTESKSEHPVPADSSESQNLEQIILTCLEILHKMYPEAVHMKELDDLVKKAIELSHEDLSDLDSIHQLGEGWTGEEALAIALYCALKYPDDIEKALTAAVNHKGDSDSTGAVCGNIMGASLGFSRIPEKFIENLELKDVILIMAQDLFDGVPGNEQYSDPSLKDGRSERNRLEEWNRKYIHMRKPKDLLY